MDTAPLPAVPGERKPRSPSTPAIRLRGFARVVEASAGLVSSGLVIVGLGLIILEFTAATIAPGSGIAAAQGPTWTRAIAHLATGIAGELAVWARPRLTHGQRVWTAVSVLAAGGAVLWLCWWR